MSRDAGLPRPVDRLLDLAAAIAPADVRGEWRREWAAESAWLARTLTRDGRPTSAVRARLIARCGGAVLHAAWLRWDRWRPEMWIYDLRIAARTLLRQPTFLALTVLTLGIGIGATVAVFGAVRAVMLRPLPFPDPDRLVSITTTSRGGAPEGSASSPPDVVDWASQQRTLAGLAAFMTDALAVSGPGAPAEQVPGASVTGTFFAVLGADAARGRTLQERDAVAGAEPVAVIADTLWARRFGRAPDVLGAAVVVDGISRTIVGVLPPGMTYPLGTEIWVPLTFTADDLATQRGAQYLDVIGRLRPEVSVAAADADLGAIAARLAATHPNTNDGRGARVRSLRAAIVGDTGAGLLLLLAAAVLVLLVVCANVAGLLLTRALGSTRTLAIRAALGASRGRLARGALLESAVLAGLGGAVGVAIAWAASRRIAALHDALRIPFLGETRLDPAVCAVALAATAVSAVVFGVAPAWRSARLGEITARARSAVLQPRTRSRAALVVVEIALALVLVVGATALVRSFARLMAVDVGFDTSDRVQTFAVSLPDAGYDTPARRAQFVARLLDAVRTAPNVERAGAVFGLPLTGFGYVITALERDGVRLPTSGPEELLVNVRVVTPDYLAAIGLPLRRGRAIEAGDGYDSPPVLLVNETAAARLWPGADAIGRELLVGARLGRDDRRLGGRVVGIVADTRERGPASPPRPTVYAAHAQFPASFMAVAMRTAGAPVPVAELQARLAAIDPEVPMFRVRTMAQLAATMVAQPRLLTLLMAVFAAAALGVAAIGVYGVLALAVEARRKEIGIRRAVGAGIADVIRLVAGDTGRLLIAGVALGLIGARAAQAMLRRFTPDAATPDGGVYAGAIAVFAVVAVVAAFVPCRRALAVDPAITLRVE